MSISWETSSAASATTSAAPVATRAGIAARAKAAAIRAPRAELLGLMALAGVLNLWALSRNGWANDYYSAAVRSMSTSWHNFLFASLDRSGVMTVDKPPLALWVQALSVRVFGYHSLSVLVPQALEGVASVALVYDLVRRRFGRVGGFVAGLALAVTPIAVAVSRHNNPDALLVLCSVAALWCAVRALERGSTRWLVLAGVFVGLGFETKMGVALTVVPGIAVAWLWMSPAGRGRLHALRQLLAGGAAMLLVAGAWPALVELTPAADRPWISGTSDNSVLSLIFNYNGLGRVDGQAGGPAGGGGGVFGSSPGPLRLVNQALGGQAGWLLGCAIVSVLALLAATRLRRSDPRSGWLIAVGGAFLTTAVLFSAASGIFHPYYVALLAPFIAALAGAGAAQLIGGRRVVGPPAIAAGVAVELVVRGQYPGQLPWLVPVLIVVGVLAALALAAFDSRRVRLAAVGAVVAALLLAPSVWAFDTLGYATSGTFPSGGPASIASAGGGGPFGGARSRAFAGGRAGRGGRAELRQRMLQLFGSGGQGPGANQPAPPPIGGGAPGFARPGGAPGGGLAAGAFGGPGGGDGSLTSILAYVKAHGGGTIAVSSQSSASAAIIAGNVDVAGIGGFSGRESDVSVSWLAQEVRSGAIRWVQAAQGSSAFSGRLPGDTRTGSRAAMAAVAKACRPVTIPATRATGTGTIGSGGTGTTSVTSGSAAATIYDCQGRGQALASAGARQ